MDSEAAVIRSEMSATRAELDRKISKLEVRAHDLTPRAVVSRHMPERALDYAIGSVLALVGACMAWGQLRWRRNRRERLVASLQIDHV